MDAKEPSKGYNERVGLYKSGRPFAFARSLRELFDGKKLFTATSENIIGLLDEAFHQCLYS